MEEIERENAPQTVTNQLFDEIREKISRLADQLKPVLATGSTEKTKSEQPQTVLIGKLIDIKDRLSELNSRVRL